MRIRPPRAPEAPDASPGAVACDLAADVRAMRQVAAWQVLDERACMLRAILSTPLERAERASRLRAWLRRHPGRPPVDEWILQIAADAVATAEERTRCQEMLAELARGADPDAGRRRIAAPNATPSTTPEAP